MNIPSGHSPPERFNIARYCLAAHAAARPDKTALIVVGGGQERRWCYGELDRAGPAGWPEGYAAWGSRPARG